MRLFLATEITQSLQPLDDLVLLPGDEARGEWIGRLGPRLQFFSQGVDDRVDLRVGETPTDPSCPADTTRFRSARRVRHRTGPRCPSRTRIQRPWSKSHTLTVPSALAVTTQGSDGCQATLLMNASCPCSVLSHSPLSRFHNLRQRSEPPLATTRPSGATSIQVATPGWVRRLRKCCPSARSKRVNGAFSRHATRTSSHTANERPCRAVPPRSMRCSGRSPTGPHTTTEASAVRTTTRPSDRGQAFCTGAWWVIMR